jgi:hypothetical protein
LQHRNTMRITLAAALVVAAAGAATAQDLRPYMAVNVGGSDSPDAHDYCSDSSHAFLGFAGGATRGRLGLEGRLTARWMASQTVCDIVAVERQDGTHTDEYDAHASADVELTPELRIRAGGVDGSPLLAFAGVGHHLGQGVWSGTLGAGVRSAGRLRLGLDVERAWYAIPRDRITREWRNGAAVSEASRSRITEWRGTWGARLVLELPVR